MRLSHEPYYTDRRSVSDLCYDFPADELLVSGLRAMQVYLFNRGLRIDIPILRVMNTVHYELAYMFNNRCTDDQTEYDVIAYNSLGCDKQLMMITMIVLTAMLQRTEGKRARQCRSVLLDDRSEDFYEGVSLYEQFIENAEVQFREEEFIINVIDEANNLREENEHFRAQIALYEANMSNTTNNPSVAIGHMSGGNIYIYNNAAPQPQKEPRQYVCEDVTPVEDYFCHITQKCIDEKRAKIVDAEIRAACKGSAEGMWRTLWDNENMGYVAVEHIDATTLYRDIEKRYGKLPYTDRQFRAARNKR